MPADEPLAEERVIRPRRGFSAINFGELWRYRELFGFLAWRDVLVRYKQTYLGIAWAVLQPMQAAGSQQLGQQRELHVCGQRGGVGLEVQRTLRGFVGAAVPGAKVFRQSFTQGGVGRAFAAQRAPVLGAAWQAHQRIQRLRGEYHHRTGA